MIGCIRVGSKKGSKRGVRQAGRQAREKHKGGREMGRNGRAGRGRRGNGREKMKVAGGVEICRRVETLQRGEGEQDTEAKRRKRGNEGVRSKEAKRALGGGRPWRSVAGATRGGIQVGAGRGK